MDEDEESCQFQLFVTREEHSGEKEKNANFCFLFSTVSAT
jgi:hypothetical protein